MTGPGRGALPAEEEVVGFGWRRPLAWGIAVIVLAIAGYVIVITFRQGAFDRADGDPVLVLIPLITAAAAMLILASRPRNPIGWLLMVWALGSAASGMADILLSSMVSPPEITFAVWLLIWFQGWSWVLFVFPIFHLPLVFPTGTVPTPRWRWLVALEAGMLLVFTFLTVFTAELELVVGETTIWSVPNPIGFITDEFWEGGFSPAWGVGLMLLTLGSASAIIVRYRRARAEERQQIKWLAYAVGMFAIVYSSMFAFSGSAEPPAWLDVLFVTSIGAIPVAIAVAVIRYRLYEIDRIVRRTFGYTAVAALLALVYLGSVSAFGAIIGRDSPLAVAGATLAAAALFNPVRRRVQRWVDRRFDRSHYDAQQVVEQFSSRLRAETDLDGLRSDLSGVIEETLRPATMSLWVREDAT
ncbi:MAG TPA: hypothetical protein VHM94_11465 [Acidimicrobiia bacterium]|jgi:hypothetical protein|nr:hypothetical protein [Acidimicrobiia bacterium]